MLSKLLADSDALDYFDKREASGRFAGFRSLEAADDHRIMRSPRARATTRRRASAAALASGFGRALELFQRLVRPPPMSRRMACLTSPLAIAATAEREAFEYH